MRATFSFLRYAVHDSNFFSLQLLWVESRMTSHLIDAKIAGSRAQTACGTSTRNTRRSWTLEPGESPCNGLHLLHLSLRGSGSKSTNGMETQAAMQSQLSMISFIKPDYSLLRIPKSSFVFALGDLLANIPDFRRHVLIPHRRSVL